MVSIFPSAVGRTPERFRVNKKKRVLLSWSSGKDSAWTLHELRKQSDVEVVGLLTTVNETHDRVAMHAVRRELLLAQAEATGLPLWQVNIPSPCSNERYEEVMRQVVGRAGEEGITHMAFGDLFLEDIRAYRESRLEGTGLEPIFPLWQRPTLDLAREMIAGGLIAHLTCVDPKQVPQDLVGRRFDESLLSDLPQSADPCGENGEFHSFVSAGPMFRAPVEIQIGDTLERDGFWFADVVPG